MFSKNFFFFIFFFKEKNQFFVIKHLFLVFCYRKQKTILKNNYQMDPLGLFDNYFQKQFSLFQN